MMLQNEGFKLFFLENIHHGLDMVEKITKMTRQITQ